MAIAAPRDRKGAAQLRLAAIVLFTFATNLNAQFPTKASAFLPRDHWSYAVLRRLDNAGLLPPGADLARQTMPQEEIAALFMHAAGADTTGMAARYTHEFREEFAVARGVNAARRDASASTSYHVRRNEVRAGVGYEDVWTGARPLENKSDVQAQVRLHYGAAFYGAAITAGVGGVAEAQGVVVSGPVGFWAGRRDIGYGTGHGGGIVLNDARFDGGGMFLTRPLRVPVVGNIRFETHVSRIHNVLNFNGSEHPIEPWFWTARGSIEPHARLRLGLNRAMMFGGEGNLPITVSRVATNLLGIYTANDETSFANQVASIDIRYRLPTGSLPTTMYLEFGADDAFGAWWRVPGTVAGVEVTVRPRHDLSFGLERTEFARNRTTNSLWYQNGSFRGSWADDGRALGHPLGGHGLEWRAFASGGSPLHGLSADMSAYTRRRRTQNIYAPERQGSSIGVMADADARLLRQVRLVFSGEVEHGTEADTWTAGTGRVGLRYLFN